MTHFQAAATIRSRDRRVSIHPTVVLNVFLSIKWPAHNAAGGNSTWLGNKMRVIGAAGKSGRHVLPLVNMGGGGGGQVMLVAGREKVHFHGMPDRINTCLASEICQSLFRIGGDQENGAILEGQRNTEMHLSATKSFKRLVFFSLSAHATEIRSVYFSWSKKNLEQQGTSFPHVPRSTE